MIDTCITSRILGGDHRTSSGKPCSAVTEGPTTDGRITSGKPDGGRHVNGNVIGNSDEVEARGMLTFGLLIGNHFHPLGQPLGVAGGRIAQLVQLRERDRMFTLASRLLRGLTGTA
jgi:hypothetical protein